jgi:RecA-family ATPase
MSDRRISDFVGMAKADAEAKATADLIAKIEKSILHFDEIKLSTGRRYLVRNIIPRTGLTVVWGAPKCGKSFWVYDLMMHVARGLKYHGRPVHQGAVVYCMFEGQGGADTRAEAYRQEKLKGDPSGPFYVETLTLDLIKNHEALIEAIKRRLGDEIPVGIVLDTLNRSLVGSESKDEDMSAYISAAHLGSR